MSMLPQDDQVTYLVGNSDIEFDTRGLKPFDELVCNFLGTLSSQLLKEVEVREFSDVVSFAFWCRKSNIYKLKEEFVKDNLRLGLGLAFHVTPSNVPVNFAFSFAISLLAGNANIVRVPSKRYKQIELICKVINKLFEQEQFQPIAVMTAFIRYEKNNETTGLLSRQCDARIIWGGNETVRQIRQLPVSERSREVIFPDRFSFAILNAKKVLQADDQMLQKLVNNFYNDTYFMDQNACSSPRLLVWLGDSDDILVAKERFWNGVIRDVKKEYELPAVNVIDKYTHFCRDAIDLTDIESISRPDNYLYRISLNNLSDKIDTLRGKFGYFYEYETDDINFVAPIIKNNYQTLTYYGIEKHVFTNFVMENRIAGIDRIVPIGSALDISVIWDGYDLIQTLSRIIEIK
ncbi:acyl-CoA reductase [Paenibacillus sp. EKM208P]|nr:acyl-CoA reductase [Paenibacillus sp. EKM208P]